MEHLIHLIDYFLGLLMKPKENAGGNAFGTKVRGMPRVPGSKGR